MKWLALPGLLVALTGSACAAQTGTLAGTGGSGGDPDPTTASSGGSGVTAGTAGDGGAGATTGTGGTGGAPECGTALDQTGCPCVAGDPPRACYVGSPAQAGIGACSLGTQSCVETQNGEQVTAAWGTCSGQGTPSPELCNDLDDDCSGVADDGVCQCTPGATQSCVTACGSGQETCVGGQWVNCDAPAPNADGSCVLNCNPAGNPPTPWEAFSFVSYAAATPCAGARYVRYMDEYSLWVGAVLCTPNRYKLFLGTAKNGTFYQMGDYAGNGQDHCEMVNDGFSIPNEDDVQSGGCATCDLGPLIFSDPGLGPVFSRATFGTCFDFEPAWPQFNLYSVEWYECGVTIP